MPIFDPRKSRSGVAGLILLIAAVLVGLLWIRVTPFTHEQLTDSRVYIAMAESPSANHPAPYCYRVLMPALARLLPFDLGTSFLLLTLVCLLGTGMLLYRVLRVLELPRFDATLGMILFFGLNWGARFALFDFRLTDPGVFLLGTASLLFLLERKNVAASLVLATGVLAKESALFVLPYAWTLHAQSIRNALPILRAVSIGLLPVTIFVALRLAVPGEYDLQQLWSSIGVERLKHSMDGFIRGGTVGTWGVLPLILVLFSGARGRAFFVRSMPFLALVYLQPFFAINVDRLLVFGFLAVIPIASFGLQRVREMFGLAPWMIAGYVCLPYLQLLARNPTNFNPPSPEQSLLVLACWTLVVAAWRFGQRRRSARGGVEEKGFRRV